MIGLLNLGNTCYFNTALQCLLHTPCLTNYFILQKYKGSCEFTNEYYRLVDHMWIKKSREYINPRDIFNIFSKKYTQFKIGEPNDVQEVVLCILDVFEQDESLGVEWVRRHFYGTLLKETDFSKVKEVFAVRILEHDMGVFEHSETIDGYELPDGSHKDTIVNHKVVHIPSIYMLSYNIYNHTKEITLDEYITFGDRTLKLYACALHQSGHYISVIKYKDDWYVKNDVHVMKMDTFIPTGPFYFAMYK